MEKTGEQKKNPVIGISCGFDFDGKYSSVKQGYYDAIIKIGGIPLLIPVCKDMDYLNGVMTLIDGLIVTGGPDIDPMYYGEETFSYNGNIVPDRDAMDIMLTKLAFHTNKPVLGICRGMQVLNVAMGGSLYQDIMSQVKNHQVLQHNQKAPVWYESHMLTLKENSLVFRCYQEPTVRVNSFHHQAVKDLAEVFEATAWTSDGIIEAYEKKAEGFAVGVQWHPETMWEKNELHLSIFKALVEQCKKTEK